MHRPVHTHTRSRARVLLPLAALVASLAGAACERRTPPEIPPPAGGNNPTTPAPSPVPEPPASAASM